MNLPAPAQPAPLRDRITQYLKRGNILTGPAASSMFGCDPQSATALLGKLEREGLVVCDRERRHQSESYVWRWAGKDTRP